MCNPHDTNSDKYDEKEAIDYDGFYYRIWELSVV
jgi:hypothetical protein